MLLKIDTTVNMANFQQKSINERGLTSILTFRKRVQKFTHFRDPQNPDCEEMAPSLSVSALTQPWFKRASKLLLFLIRLMVKYPNKVLRVPEMECEKSMFSL